MKMSSIYKPFHALIHLKKKPHTIRYPAQKHFDMLGNPVPTDRYRGTHENDIDRCIGCQMCGRICMNQAITYVEIPELKDITTGVPVRPVVDYGRCCYCGLCVEVCPTKSLHLTKQFEHIHTDKRTFRFLPTADIKGEDFTVDITKVVLVDKGEFEKKKEALINYVKSKKEQEAKKAEESKEKK